MRINKKSLLNSFTVREKKQLLVLMLVLLGVWGLLYMRYCWTSASQATSDNALTIARTAGTSFPKKILSSMNNPNPEYFEALQYEQIKYSLLNLVSINPKIRVAYIYVQRAGKLYLMSDSEPLDSKDYSPLGQEYEATKVFSEPFENGNPK